MRIEQLTLQGSGGSRTRKWSAINSGLNVVFGPPNSGKTLVAELLACTLLGQQPTGPAKTGSRPSLHGEVIVESGDRRYRLRRYDDIASTPKLTVAALDGSPVDRGLISRLVSGLSPTVLAALCAVSFRQPPEIGRLLSADFARDFQSICGPTPSQSRRRTNELAARRDVLAQELESRIAGERRVSKELDSRWHELDRLVSHEQQAAATCEERLRAVETALAETDARLRYRRLELNVQLRWHTPEPEDCQPQLAELDEQIERWRVMLADLAQREATVRARLAETRPAPADAAAIVADERAWLAVVRQLAADLVGEIARLARASASQQCVCRDAHPRLRPIAETVQRQLDVLESLVNDQQRVLNTAALQDEVEHLSRTQTELQRHLEGLLDRRQALARGGKSARTPALHAAHAGQSTPAGDRGGDGRTAFSAADAEQLESRRMELEQERFQLVEQTRHHSRKLRDLRAQRDTVERQRAALLSARSIEHVQRELADVQRKLEQATGTVTPLDDVAITPANPSRASDFLAQLSDGALVRLVLAEHGRRAQVVDRAGAKLTVDALPAAERDLVYLSLCLGLLSAAAQRGVWLPLVLDDPFNRLDAGRTAALAAVLDDFCRRGHQVLLFTSQLAAAERFTSIGATVRDIDSFWQLDPELPEILPPRQLEVAKNGPAPEKAKPERRRTNAAKRRKAPPRKTLHGEAPGSGRSDAA